MASSHEIIAGNYFRRLGKPTQSGDCEIVGGFVKRLGDIGVLGQMSEAWILRSGMNQGSGSVAKGLLGRADMTLTASPTWGESGLTFNGTSQVGSATLPATQTSGTLVLIYASSGTQPTTFAAPGAIVAAAGRATVTTGGTVATVFYNNAAPINFNCYNGTSAVTVAQPSYLHYNTTDTAFQCVAVANDSSGGALGFRVSVDGILPSQQSTPSSATSQTLANACDRIVIAGSWSGSVHQLFFSGTIAFAAVFRTALSEAQLLDVYRAARATIAQGLAWRIPVWLEGDSQAAATTLGTASDRWHNKLFATAGTRWGGKAAYALTGAGFPATGGDTVATRLAAWDGLCPGQRPVAQGENGWMFLCAGINDLGNGRSVDGTFADIVSICKKGIANGFKIGLFSLPANNNNLTVDFQGRLADLNRRIAAYGQSSDVRLLVPLHTLFGSWNAGDFVDGVHLGIAAQTRIADYIFEKVPNPAS